MNDSNFLRFHDISWNPFSKWSNQGSGKFLREVFWMDLVPFLACGYRLGLGRLLGLSWCARRIGRGE